MATKTDPSAQVKFLVSCVRHANKGRPDFAAVANELNIATKAAAQKRYERMLKAHNVSGTSPPSPTESEATPKKSAGKKRGGGAAAATTEETPTKKRTHLPKSKPVKEETGDEDDKPIKKVEDEGSEYSPLSDAPSESSQIEVQA